MAIYAYVRKTYPIPTIEQLDMITNCGLLVQEIYLEEFDLKKHQELEELLSILKKNDHIVICDLRVFSKGLPDFRKLLREFWRKEIRLTSLLEEIDTQMSPLFYSDVIKVLRMGDEHRRHIIKTTIDKSKLEGKRHGRPTIDTDTINQIIFLSESQKKTMREVADICKVSIGTVHKYTKKRQSDSKEVARD